jgi:hypothetical protein
VASAEGASISELAERLALGPRTVERLLTDALEVLGLTEADALGPLLAASPGGCISRTSRGRTAPESSPRRSGAAPRMPESRGAG